jgi:hypothetical protein
MIRLTQAISGLAGAAILFGALAATPAAYGQNGNGQGASAHAPDLSACPDLEVPEGNREAFHLYATGVQLYFWNGTSWGYGGPEATLSADPNGNSVVGVHYGGPTWVSTSGSGVIGKPVKPCTVDPTAIPWLLLEAQHSKGPGIFENVTYIQRVNTTGGMAPTDEGSYLYEYRRVPYTAEYVFYKARP